MLPDALLSHASPFYDRFVSELSRFTAYRLVHTLKISRQRSQTLESGRAQQLKSKAKLLKQQQQQLAKQLQELAAEAEQLTAQEQQEVQDELLAGPDKVSVIASTSTLTHTSLACTDSPGLC